MAGTARVKEEALENAKNLGHQMAPFTPQGDKEFSHCRTPGCQATIIVQGSDATGFAITHICPFLEHQSQNGHPET